MPICSICLRDQAGYLDFRVAYRHFSFDVWIQSEWEHYISGRCSIQDAVHLKAKRFTRRSRYSTKPLRREVLLPCYRVTTCEKKQNKSESLRSVKPKMSSKSSKTWRKSTKDRGRGKPIELDDWLHIRARRVSGCHGPLCRIPLQGLNCAN